MAPVVEVAEGCLDFPVLCFSLIGLLDPLILSMLIKEKKVRQTIVNKKSSDST